MKGGNHYGIAAFYSERALDADMIGVTMCNTTPKVAVWGSKAPVLGTNPFSIAVPAKTRYPLIFDAATSVLARGKVIMADAEGKQLPEGAALDQYGLMEPIFEVVSISSRSCFWEHFNRNYENFLDFPLIFSK